MRGALEWEENVDQGTRRVAREKVIKESFLQPDGGGGPRRFREVRGGSANVQHLGRPDHLWGSSCQAGAPVIPFRLLDCLGVREPGGSCRR